MTSAERTSGTARGSARFNDWQRELADRLAAHKYLFGFLRLLALSAGSAICLVAGPITSAMMFGWCILFFFNVPANYYYVFLALLPVVFWREENASLRDCARIAVAMVLVAIFPIMPAITPDHILFNGYFNWAILVAWVLLAASFVPRTILSNIRIRR